MKVLHIKAYIMATPPGLLLILHAKSEFITTNIQAGRVPNPQQTASFIRETVVALGPQIQQAGPAVGATLKAKFAAIGWDVLGNSPSAGSTAPPAPEELLQLFLSSFAVLRPSLKAAKDGAAAALNKVADEKRELAFAEEDAAEGGGGAKAQKKLEALQQRIPALEAAAAAAAALAKAVESQSSEGEAATLAQAEAEAAQQRAARVAAMTTTAGRRGSTAGGGRGGGGRGRGGGGGGGGRGPGSGTAAAPAPAPAAGGNVDMSSDVSIVDPSTLRKGGYIMINDSPCRIRELSR